VTKTPNSATRDPFSTTRPVTVPACATAPADDDQTDQSSPHTDPGRQPAVIGTRYDRRLRAFAILIVLALGRTAAAEDNLTIDWFAVDLDLGGGMVSPATEGVFLSRVRVGYVGVRGQILSSIGTAAELKDRTFTFGLAGELVSVRSGLAMHFAAMSSTSGAPTVELGGGWAGLRLEGQLTLADRTGVAILAFARLPLGAVAYKLWGERHAAR
jgi:hypothetical protein